MAIQVDLQALGGLLKTPSRPCSLKSSAAYWSTAGTPDRPFWQVNWSVEPLANLAKDNSNMPPRPISHRGARHPQT